MTTKRPRLKLKGILPALWPQARRHINAGNIGGFLSSTDSGNSMHLVTRNWWWLEQRGLHVKALLRAWSNQKIAYRWEPAMRYFLLECDREELVRCCDPFPEGDSYTLYRGVQNFAHRQSNPHGISWTTSLEVAKRFAGEDGNVYMATVRRKDVHARIHESGRGEHEMLLLLNGDEPLAVVGGNREEECRGSMLFCDNAGLTHRPIPASGVAGESPQEGLKYEQ
ncbi:MAG: hypothetical protein ACLGXA_17720 [Acidobacteriota bacterium]